MLFSKQITEQIIINCESLETRVAVLNEGNLEAFSVERPSEERVVGSIFKGRIQNLEDGLQAAFVDIGLKKNAFIHYWDMIPEDMARLEAEEGVSRSRTTRRKRYAAGEMAKIMPVGSDIIVQVTKDAIGTKGPRVTANLSIPGRYLVMLPGCELRGVSRKIEDEKERARLKKIMARLPVVPNNGFIIRTAGSGGRKTTFARDMRALVAIWQDIEEGIKNKPAPCRLYQEPDLAERVVRDSLTSDIDRIIVDNREVYERLKTMVSKLSRIGRARLKLYDGDAPIFEHFDVERQIESAFRRKVWLKSGGYIIFDETEALVAVDVNTGRHKGGKTQDEAIHQVNIEAAQEIGRQLQLRNVGGLIVIDFIDMRQRRHQMTVYKELKNALKNDKARTNVLPISALGLLEMTRQRAEGSIRASNYAECPYCRGRGVVKNPLSMSVDIQRHIAAILRRQRKDKHPLRITLHPRVLERMRSEDESILVDMEKKFETSLSFVADGNLHAEDFVIANADSGEELYRNSDH